MHCLEIFNLRNDKVDLYNRIFFFNIVKNLIKKKITSLLKYIVITMILKNFTIH